MSKRTIGFILIAVGAVGVVVSLAADMLGVGTYPGINGTQLLGAVIGLVLAAAGGWMASQERVTTMDGGRFPVSFMCASRQLPVSEPPVNSHEQSRHHGVEKLKQIVPSRADRDRHLRARPEVWWAKCAASPIPCCASARATTATATARRSGLSGTFPSPSSRARCWASSGATGRARAPCSRSSRV